MEIAVDFFVLALSYIFLFYKNWRKAGKDVLLVNTTMFVYISFVLYFTLMPITTSLFSLFDHPYVPMNLIPFIDVIEGRGDFAKQVWLNILMTVPFGILFPMTKKGNGKFLKVVLYAFCLSLSIELLQPLLNGLRSSDITDLITNISGAVIGYGIYPLTRPFSSKILDLLSAK